MESRRGINYFERSGNIIRHHGKCTNFTSSTEASAQVQAGSSFIDIAGVEYQKTRGQKSGSIFCLCSLIASYGDEDKMQESTGSRE